MIATDSTAPSTAPTALAMMASIVVTAKTFDLVAPSAWMRAISRRRPIPTSNRVADTDTNAMARSPYLSAFNVVRKRPRPLAVASSYPAESVTLTSWLNRVELISEVI